MSTVDTADAASPLHLTQSELGDLHGALAHEISQPLTSILINAQAALRFLDEGLLDPAEHRKILEDIVRDNKRAGAVIQNLRSMLALMPAEREYCCLNSIVEEVLDFMKNELVARQVKVRFFPGGNLPKVPAARVEIQQVLVNLLLNAVQAMSGTSLPCREIVIHTQYDGVHVSAAIRDRGCGIPEDQEAAIFMPFYTTKAQGLGIGLAICRRILDGHGGKIEAHRELIGTSFVFFLPLP